MVSIAHLRTYPSQFGWHTVKYMPKFKTRGEGRPAIPEDSVCDGPELFREMSWETDLDWGAARLTSAIVYLRGSSALRLPQRWRDVFPTHLPIE